MRYPISIQTFSTIIDEGWLYVDKTSLVYDLAQQHICFLSRPRRFGKSLLLSTLDAYFSGRKDLFKGLQISQLETEWKQYKVFKIDFSNGNFTNPLELEKFLDGLLLEMEKTYALDTSNQTIGNRFLAVLKAAEQQSGKRIVVLIDEYDKPLLDALGTPLENINRNILRSFYGTFKAADAFLRFVLLTGVTKFSQISVFSDFNQPNDISMDSHYDAICGITENELFTVFSKPIQQLADKYGYSVEKMQTNLKRQYDGYHFSENLTDIYNPFSILNSFFKMKIDDYWYSSGTPIYLKNLLEGHHVNMQRLLAETYDSSKFMDYRADAEDPLAMLYQSGYLTIKKVVQEGMRLFYALDYPNDEVRRGFVTLVANSYFKNSQQDTDNWILKLNRLYCQGDLDGIRDAFTAFLSSIPYEADKDVRAMNFETHFQYTFYILNRLLSCYTTLLEKQNSCGRADMIIESVADIYILEFKIDGNADEALHQIEEKQYALPYLDDSRHLHRIGVIISSTTRTIADWKVVD